MRGMVMQQQQQYQQQYLAAQRNQVALPVSTSTPIRPTYSNPTVAPAAKAAATPAGPNPLPISLLLRWVLRSITMLVWVAARLLVGPVLAAIGGLIVVSVGLSIAEGLSDGDNPVTSIIASPNAADQWPGGIAVVVVIGVVLGLLYWGGLSASWVSDGWMAALTPLALAVPVGGGLAAAFLFAWLFEAGTYPTESILVSFPLAALGGSVLASLYFTWEHAVERWRP